MADITIVPPAIVPTVNSGQQTPSATDSTSPQPALPPGTLVSGTIVGKDTAGNFLLKSLEGTFSLKSATPLTYNSDVTIRIGQNASGSTSARIISVNGTPFSEFSTPEPETSDSVSTSLLSQTARADNNTQPQTPANSFRAVVVSAPPQPQAGAEQQALAPGSTVLVRLSPSSPEQAQTVEQPAATATESGAPLQTFQNPQPAAAQAQPASPPAPGPASAPLAAAANVSAAPVETELNAAQTVNQASQTPQLETGQQAPQPQSQPAAAQSAAPANSPQAAPAPAAPLPSVSAQYDVYAKSSVATPTATVTSAAAPAPAAPAVPTSLPAQIIGSDAQGTVTLQTALGQVSLRPTSPVPEVEPGASAVVEFLTAQASQNTSAPASLSEIAASWESLKAIVEVAGGADNQASAALLARLPQIGPDFASSGTAFLTALLQNDARKLLGDDTIETLRRHDRLDLLERFSGEVENLNQSFTAANQRPVPGWQTFFLPFVYQEALQQARIYVKREPPKKDRANAKSSPETRFVVEVDLSELGSLQMDGLVRRKPQGSAFDLVIRSRQPFAPEDQAEIHAIYTSAAELTGFKGTLAFQVTRDFPVKPLEEAAGELHAFTV